jgi:hypothetical protein
MIASDMKDRKRIVEHLAWKKQQIKRQRRAIPALPYDTETACLFTGGRLSTLRLQS